MEINVNSIIITFLSTAVSHSLNDEAKPCIKVQKYFNGHIKFSSVA